MRISTVSVILLALLMAGCAQPRNDTSAENVHYILGVSYLQEGDSARALREFHQAHQVQPRNPNVLIGLGRSYHLRGAHEQAEHYYRLALRERPDDSMIENNLGDLYLSQGRLEEAIYYFEKAASNLMFTDSAVSLTGLGYAHFLNGDYPEALRAYRRALAQNPRSDQTYMRLGETYYAMDNPERAVGALRQALRINASNIQAHYKLGMTQMKLGNDDAALQSFSTLIKLAPLSELAEQAEGHIETLR